MILDLCLSCKGCKSECPSNVDMAKLKAEFLHQYYQSNKIPFRTKMIANISRINQNDFAHPWDYQLFSLESFNFPNVKENLGFAPERKLPLLYKTTLKTYLKRNKDLKPKWKQGRKEGIFICG